MRKYIRKNERSPPDFLLLSVLRTKLNKEGSCFYEVRCGHRRGSGNKSR